VTTEDLSPKQLERLLAAIEQDAHPQAGNVMKMALFSGMRAGEIFGLKWEDVNFLRGFISIRAPKGGVDQTIPLPGEIRKLLREIKKTDSPYIFPGKDGKKRPHLRHAVNKIKKAARLPGCFRGLHGLRHVYASMLASSGEVDMYTLQKLLTHKSPGMTARYAHLRDEALKRASNLAGEIIGEALRK